jgi:hypothetical protein
LTRTLVLCSCRVLAGKGQRCSYHRPEGAASTTAGQADAKASLLHMLVLCSSHVFAGKGQRCSR